MHKKTMTEVIPSINVGDFAEAKKRIALVEKFVKWIHLDVSDGVFTKHVSWHEPKDLIDFKSEAKIEVHLMIDRPEKEIDQWLVDSVNRVIFHHEATDSHKLLIEKIHQAKKEAGIAIKPDTSWIKLFPYFNPPIKRLGKVEVLQLLAVNPGPSGQKFEEEILHKLGHVRSLCPECTIEIDGGVNRRVAAQCAAAGANILVAGSAIFGAKDIKKAIEELQNL